MAEQTSHLKSLFETMAAANGHEIPPEAPPAVSAPRAPEVGDPGFEHYPGRIDSAATSIRGLARVLTTEGRSKRAEDRAERLQRRVDVARFIGDRITNPTVNNGKLTSRGNTGINMLIDPRYTEGSEYFGTPNRLRPITRSEKSADIRLDRIHGKAVKLRDKNGWVKASTEASMTLHRGHHTLDKSEKKYARGISNQLESTDKKVQGLDTKFEKVAETRDIRGKLVRKRLERADNYDERVQARRNKAMKPIRKVKQFVADKRLERAENHDERLDARRARREKVMKPITKVKQYVASKRSST